MPLFWLSVSFLAGILLAAWQSLSLLVWLEFAGLSFLLAVFSWRITLYIWEHWGRALGLIFGFLPMRGVRGIVSLRSGISRMQIAIPWLVVAIFLGGARYQAAQPEIGPNDLEFYNDMDASVILEGWLVEPPDLRDQFSLLRIQVDRIRTTDQKQDMAVKGQLLVRSSPGLHWVYGDQLRLEGYLVNPPEQEGFSYRQYLARQGIYSYMATGNILHVGSGEGNRLAAAAYHLRQLGMDLVYKYWPDPEASLLAGILLGVETGIPADLAAAFRDTGTAHIIAISGSNIAILAGFVALTLGRLLDARRRFWVAGLSTILVLGYAFLVGWDAAVVRAAIMGGVTLFAAPFGRRPNGLNSLAFVAAVMALFTPSILWDVSFQLSFMATLGLVLFAVPFSDALSRMITRWWGEGWAARLTGPIGEYVLFTLAAQLTTLPVILAQFERLSVIGLLANPLILPAQPAVMASGGLALLSGVLIQPLGQFIAWFAWPFMRYTIAVVELLGRVPGAAWTVGPVSKLFIAAYIIFILAIALFLKPLINLVRRVADLLGGKVSTATLLVLMMLTSLVWRSALHAPDGRLHLTVLDTGGGEALLIQTPTGRHLLINGGARASQLSSALGRRLQLFDRRLDWLVVGGVRDEQIGALPVTIERYPPDAVLWAGPTAGSDCARVLYRQLEESQIDLINPQMGQALDLGGGARLEFLALTPRGAVLLLEWEEFRALLPVGLDFEALEALLARRDLAQLNALLLPDNGYAPLNPPGLFASMQPQVVLLSVAAGNREEMPSPKTLQGLLGYNLLRTDHNGWIEITTDGELMWIEVEKR